MNYKSIAIICGALCALCFGLGRYTSKPQIVEKIKTVEVEKEVIKHETQYITIVKKPDGTETTTIDKETDSQSNTTKNTDTTVKFDTGHKSNLSFLVGAQPKLFGGTDLGPIAIGASWNTQPITFLPVTLGIWGIATTPAVGVSVGWNY